VISVSYDSLLLHFEQWRLIWYGLKPPVGIMTEKACIVQAIVEMKSGQQSSLFLHRSRGSWSSFAPRFTAYILFISRSENRQGWWHGSYRWFGRRIYANFSALCYARM